MRWHDGLEGHFRPTMCLLKAIVIAMNRTGWGGLLPVLSVMPV